MCKFDPKLIKLTAGVCSYMDCTTVSESQNELLMLITLFFSFFFQAGAFQSKTFCILADVQTYAYRRM